MENHNYDNLKILLWLLLFLVFGIIIITCKPKPGGRIMTVNGSESSGKMGITLIHEHILTDFIGAKNTGYSRWNRDSVISKALPLILDAKRKGLKTLIDCSTAYFGRDPLMLKELSRKAGINIITNIGYFGVSNNKYLPDSFYSMDASELAAQWISEYENGIEGTGIKPGFIKIGVDDNPPLSAEHRKLVAAAALTHLKTGLVIESHTRTDEAAREQLDIIREMGVDPAAFIWVHSQRGTLEAVFEAAKEGVWISLDNVCNRPDLNPGDEFSIDWYADRIMKLKEKGFIDKILLSHDSGWYDPSKPSGGTFKGYTDIFDYLVPAMKIRGFTEDELNKLLSKNPAAAFTIRIRKPGSS
jgi:phosphotriesterase-related protein